jgi:microcystin-dependent protein
MAYQVTFTESNNPQKPPITVEDSTVNTQTSVTLIGKNYSGYGPLLAKNFVHLLENFAGPTPPTNPVQGQLWFDNAADVSQLKVNIAGTSSSWVSAGGVKKSPSAPVSSSSIQGDLWVDTVNQQLSLFTGSSWLLVGPTFSQGSQTGPKLEQIVDNQNISHTVQSIYVENNRVMIISNTSFTPKSLQAGFETIKKGLNLNTPTLAGIPLFRYNGIATQADSLSDPTTGIPIPTSSFLRSDQPSTSNYSLNIRNRGGITVGDDTGAITLYTENATGASTFYAKSGNSVDFKLNVNGSAKTVLHLDPNAYVGINKSNPTVALDVNGYIAAGQIALSSTDADSVTLAGGIIVNGNSQLTTLQVNSKLSVGGNIQPLSNNVYTIGSDPTVTGGAQFASIYAANFYGNFNGTFSAGTLINGSISGSATKLTSPTVFSIAGDIVNALTDNTAFDGQNQTVTFNTKLASIAVTGQTALTQALGNESVLVFSPQSSSLRKITVANLTTSFPTVPIAAIYPFAGPSTQIPKGYLLCDGSEISQSAYSALFGIIGYTYKAVSTLQGAGTFCLPDFRGRMPLGLDNMNNGIQVNTPAGVPVYTVSATAGRVTNSFASNLGGNSGQEKIILTVGNLPQHTHTLKGSAGGLYFAVRNVAGNPDDTDAVSGPGGQAAAQAQYLQNSGGVSSDTHGDTVNVMNPYLAINYIIFTGVLV